MVTLRLVALDPARTASVQRFQNGTSNLIKETRGNLTTDQAASRLRNYIKARPSELVRIVYCDPRRSRRIQPQSRDEVLWNGDSDGSLPRMLTRNREHCHPRSVVLAVFHGQNNAWPHLKPFGLACRLFVGP